LVNQTSFIIFYLSVVRTNCSNEQEEFVEKFSISPGNSSSDEQGKILKEVFKTKIQVQVNRILIESI